MKNDSQARKWLITINNPLDKGFNQKEIKNKLNSLSTISYYCMADEIAETGTPHTHIFIYSKSPIRFTTLKNAFPPADLENAKGSAAECKSYVEKSGKWVENKKGETSVPDTFLEWGEFPQERQGARTDFEDIYEMIKDGATNEQIREKYPAQFILHSSKIERTRQGIIEEQYQNEFREMFVTYIFGKPKTGKTRYVLEKYGYANVCHITSYKNPMIFDNYKNSQDVLCLDEFIGHLEIPFLNGLLDGYPKMLPCRYSDKVACFTKVYLISNLPLEQQYQNQQYSQPDIWNALIRRISKVMVFNDDSSYYEYDTRNYFNRFTELKKLPEDFPIQWDNNEMRC